MPGPGRPFVKGSIPNPLGRPKGSRSKSTLALQALLDGEAETIMRRVAARAKKYDPVAMRLVVERIMPPLRERATPFEMPPLDGPEDLPAATAALVRAVADGDLMAGEAAAIAKLFDLHIHAVEVHDLGREVAELKASMTSGASADGASGTSGPSDGDP